MGYSVFWNVFNTSKYTEIPQNRERTFIICFKDEADWELNPKKKSLSKLFNEIESGHITNGSVNNADTNQKFNTSKILPAYISTGISPGVYGPSNLPLP